jgi:hypothetical protein
MSNLSTRCTASVLAIGLGVGLALLTPGFATVEAQREAQPPAANPPGPITRTADGQPNIQGAWDSDAYEPDLETGIDDPETAQIQGRATGPRVEPPKEVSAIIDPPDGKIPYQAWAQARRLSIPSFRRGVNRGQPKTLREMRPRTFCLHAPPRSTIGGFEAVQVPGYVIFVWEFSHAYRIIPLDGRPRLAPHLKLAMGDARGRWEGQTLIVETTNLNDWDWFDYTGTFHTDATTVVERFRLIDSETIDYRFTVTNPEVFTRPWTARASLKRNLRQAADWEMLEAACVEGERGVEAIMGADPRKK